MAIQITCIGVGGVSRPASAQVTPLIDPTTVDSVLAGVAYARLPLLGGPLDETHRARQILAPTSGSSPLIRSPSSLLFQRPEGWEALQLIVLVPEVRSVYNSSLPFSINEGSLWAGRGVNTEWTGGIAARIGPVELVVAPQVVSSANRDFQIMPYATTRTPERSPFAAAWYYPPESIDRPQRFGDQSLRTVTLGQSSLQVRAGPVAVGAATENLWWGPGTLNALVMSNNAPGIPHGFLRTSRPISTPVGTVEARWIIGGLSGSDYFDSETPARRRSISALAVTLSPPFEPNLTLGYSRAVYADLGGGRLLGDALHVLGDPGRPAADAAADRHPGSADQIFSLFGRWVLPGAGLEVYGEWGRTERPRSIRDFLLAPHHTQGYTMGLQWISPFTEETELRLGLEATNLELSSTYRSRPTLSWYTSPAVPEGYTHHGRVIGAGIGPGASSQWGRADLIARHWSVGLYGGRIRWDNGVFYSRVPSATYLGHDVSIHGGVRGSFELGPVLVTADLGTFSRFNYLFQHSPRSIGDIESVDIANRTLRVGIGKSVGPGLASTR